MTPDTPSDATKEGEPVRRWTLNGTNYAQRPRCDGPDIPVREVVEVMPVADHEKAMESAVVALQARAVELHNLQRDHEAALLAARQVDEAMVERALAQWVHEGNDPDTATLPRYLRAALLAALNAPKPTSKESPRPSQDLEGER